MEHTRNQGLATAVAAALSVWTMQATADPGFYIGASVGDATIESSDTIDGGSFDFDESDTGYKVFGGFMFNDYLGVELGYTDLGSPGGAINFGGLDGAESIDAEASGITLQGIGALPLGPVDVFAKIGMVSYDAELELVDPSGIFSGKVDADGEELAYGVGAILNLGAFGIRAEYEIWDVGDVDDVYMISVGAQLTF